MLPGNVLLIAELMISLVVQAAAAKMMFVAPQGVPPRMRFVASCFLVCGATQVVLLSRLSIGVAGIATGSLLYASALSLFIATCRANKRRLLSVAFTEDVPEHLVVWGPYEYVRHPYYASYCLTWVAGFAATGNELMFGTFLLMLALYVLAARFEERKFFMSSYASAYDAYVRTTGMFIPRLLLPSAIIGQLRMVLMKGKRRWMDEGSP